MTTNGLLVHFAGNTIRIQTADAGISKLVETHFKHSLGEDGPIIAEYRIVPGADGAFTLSRGDQELLAGVDLGTVLAHLMQDALTQLNGASTTHLIFHAAAIASAGKAVVLFGKTGWGKSTLAASLVASGLQYLTDEVIALPFEDTGQISGLCRSLVLKKGSGYLLERWKDQPEVEGLLRFKDGGAWVDPTVLNPLAVQLAARPRLLVFAHYLAGEALLAGQMTAGDSLFHMLQGLVNARNFPDGGLAAASRLARGVPAFSLTYSDLDEAAAWIKQQLKLA